MTDNTTTADTTTADTTTPEPAAPRPAYPLPPPTGADPRFTYGLLFESPMR
jgi:hypothetical protein